MSNMTIYKKMGFQALFKFVKCWRAPDVVRETFHHLPKRTPFRCLRKSLIALLIVVCGKLSQICCFYNVNKHVGYDMTSTVTSFVH